MSDHAKTMALPLLNENSVNTLGMVNKRLHFREHLGNKQEKMWWISHHSQVRPKTRTVHQSQEERGSETISRNAWKHTPRYTPGMSSPPAWSLSAVRRSETPR
ncbi:unnamed protein product [Ectocarpus sp. 12 AP-2014]